MEPLEGTRYWEEVQSPELRYLQLKRPGDITWQDKVYDALGRQVQDAQALRQVKESSPVLIHTSDPAHADERMLVSRSHGSEPEARAALSELCEAYYAPVMAFLRRVLASLEAKLRDSGKGHHFDTLKPWLTADGDATPQAEAAAKLGISEDAVKVAIHRLRKRFRDAVKTEIAQTVSDLGNVRDELEALMNALRGG